MISLLLTTTFGFDVVKAFEKEHATSNKIAKRFIDLVKGMILLSFVLKRRFVSVGGAFLSLVPFHAHFGNEIPTSIYLPRQPHFVNQMSTSTLTLSTPPCTYNEYCNEHYVLVSVFDKLGTAVSVFLLQIA